jgi:diguanylate cyclase (GGDEF)-like protein
LARILATAGSDRSEHALCYIDLDQFKIINDTCGHAAGDELLRQLGAMLPIHVRYRDTLAHLGGDEFGILMEHYPLAQAMRVANAIHASFEEFRFFWADKSFSVGVSIGLVPIVGVDVTVADVLSAADGACYAAKESGRNHLHVYHSDDHELLRRHTEMQWVRRLNRELDEDDFELFFQSIVPLEPTQANGRHYEVLLRLRENDAEVIAPGAFLQAAERYGYAVRIDKWVVDHTFQWLSAVLECSAELDLCSINLSGQTLGNESFLDFILERLEHYQIPGERIFLEITETAMVVNLPRAQRLISALRHRGIRFELDDFGSGFASFSYIKNLAVDFVKIDGIFVKDIVDDEIDREMVRAINHIGKVLGKQTIAEFAENEAILAELRNTGVDYAQGSGIDKPSPLG